MTAEVKQKKAPRFPEPVMRRLSDARKARRSAFIVLRDSTPLIPEEKKAATHALCAKIARSAASATFSSIVAATKNLNTAAEIAKKTSEPIENVQNINKWTDKIWNVVNASMLKAGAIAYRKAMKANTFDTPDNDAVNAAMNTAHANRLTFIATARSLGVEKIDDAAVISLFG